jgi:Sortase domain
MVSRVTRRRAVARGLALLGLLMSSAVSAPQAALAQLVDPPSDVPWPADSSPTSTPAPVVDSGLPAPATDAGSPVPAADTGSPTPAFAPEEEVAPGELPGPAAAAVAPVNRGVPPVKVVIPVLGVEAEVEAVGEDPDGAMSVPTDPDDVAWYDLGPGMGVPGNVVFAGHINWNGRTRAFGLLDRLDPGDVIQVIDAQGRGFEYAVESSHWVRAEGAPIDEIFAQPAEPVITLITCGGEFVPSRREYLDRLIVRARGA